MLERPEPSGGKLAPARECALVWLIGGGLLLLIGLMVARPLVPYDADVYDEGLICQGGALALHGQWPGASFYAPYPPGAFAGVALTFRFWGTRVLVERWLAAALAALAGALGFVLISGFPSEETPVARRQSPGGRGSLLASGGCPAPCSRAWRRRCCSAPGG